MLIHTKLFLTFYQNCGKTSIVVENDHFFIYVTVYLIFVKNLNIFQINKTLFNYLNYPL